MAPNTSPGSSQDQQHGRRWTAVSAVLLVIAAGLFQLYGMWDAMGDDEGSYLDIARRLALGDWAAALNGYWSPLYPFLISLALRIAPGAPQFLLIQFVNFGIFLAAAGAFWWLWMELRGSSGTATAALAFSTCVFSLLRAWRQPVGSPDALVAGFVFLTAALLLYLRRQPRHTAVYLVLGTILALGYFSKSMLFAVSLLAIAIAGAGGRKVVQWRAVLSLAVFACLAAPLVTGLSRRYGHLTFSESGRLNYAWWVAGVPMYVDWFGDPIGGQPIHPPRLLSRAPAVIAFSGAGTYPPWYEPSYWYAGVKAHASTLRWMERVARNFWKTLLLPQSLLLLALLVISAKSLSRVRQHWRLLVLAILPVLAYCLITTTERYVAGFLTVALAAILARVPPPRLISWPAVAAMIFATLFSGARLAQNHSGREDALAAQAVLNTGVKAGSRIGIIGNSRTVNPAIQGASFYGSTQELWAWPAKYRIVSEIRPEEASLFDQADTEEKIRLLALMTTAGAEAVVAVNHPLAAELPGWSMARAGHLSIYRRR